MSDQPVRRRPTTLSDHALLGVCAAMLLAGIALVTLDVPDVALGLARSYVLLVSVGILAAALVISRTYWRNFRIAPAKARLLPRHVIQLGVLVVGLLAILIILTIDRVDEVPFNFVLPIAMPSLTAGAFGMVDMLRWLPDRRREVQATGVMQGRRKEDRDARG